MKILLALMLWATPALADEPLHFAASYAIGMTVYETGRHYKLSPGQSWLIGFSVAVAANFAKEAIFNPHYERGSLEAGALGSGLGVTVPILIEHF